MSSQVRPVAVLEHRVTMSDTDLVQVSFVSYFRWMDDGFHELLVQLGRPLRSILASGHGTPVVDASCSYLAPVGVDDLVRIESRVGRIGSTSFEVEHSMSVDGERVAEGRLKHVWIDLEPIKRAAQVPTWLRQAGTVA
jgi:YbgC/YbaW family acyl-CoA thioester hydrolase